MPVQEGYIYADEAHDKVKVDGTFRYGCHSYRLGEGWRGVKPWIEQACGHLTKTSDPACESCSNRDIPDGCAK